MRKFYFKWSLPHVSLLLLLCATLFMLAVGLWEIAAPFGAGHAAVLPARAIMADNMVRYGIFYPVRSYFSQAPDISQAYAHHPWGTYYLFALVRWVFGRQEWAIRLVPVCMSVAMPSLFYFVAARLWGKGAGAVAALGWAVLPITLAFAQFPSFEMFSIAGMLGVYLAGLRYEEKRTRSRLIQLFIAAFLAANTDWLASLGVFAVAMTALLLSVYVPSKFQKERDFYRLIQGLLGAALVVVFTVLLYVWVFYRAQLFTDFTTSAEFRSRGNELPFSEIIRYRRYWIELMFTKPGLIVSALGAVVMLVRTVVFRSFREALPLFLLATASFHYVYFKNGADIHIYWPLPFAAQFCLSLGVLFVSVEGGLLRLSERMRRNAWVRHANGLALGSLIVTALLVLPDGLRALDYSRDTGFRLNDDGQLNLQDYDKNLAFKSFQPLVPKGKTVALSTSVFPNWSQDYALERPTVIRSGPTGLKLSNAEHAVFDLRFASATTMTWAKGAFHRVVGPYLFTHVTAEGEPNIAKGFVRRAPSFLERLFVQSHDPIYSITPDPYLTWELREHFAISPNPIPDGLDRVEHRVIAHNVAVAIKDEAKAKSLFEAIEQELDKGSARICDDGTLLLGHRLLASTPKVLEVYFLAAHPLGADAFFDVRSRVMEAPRFSFVMADEREKKYGVGFVIHPSLWKSKWLYVNVLEVRERPGTEIFYGRWRGNQIPHCAPGDQSVLLFERP
jgi:4-amino-4-deoxy-L-arabinose transferase-like glycosyltransferase